jgi:hypothetical protein
VIPSAFLLVQTRWFQLLSLGASCRQPYEEMKTFYTMNIIRFDRSRVFCDWFGIIPYEVLVSIKAIRFNKADCVLYRYGLSRRPVH